MMTYILRRLLYAIPILITVNLLTFLLFFVVNTPDDMARVFLGDKRITAEQISNWKHERGYDLPLFLNTEAIGFNKISQTIFAQKALPLFVFDFGRSDSGRDIAYDIRQRMWPSLAIALPTLLLGLAVTITLALLFVFFRQSYVDYWGMVICVLLMSISSLFYIIAGQFIFAKVLHLVPVSGFGDGLQAWNFVILPVVVGVIGGIGGGVRWYRTLFIEEMDKDYVRTAFAKGLPAWRVMFSHILPNGMIPILTGVVVILPTLFMGSLLIESFFGIPGLGSYTIDAIQMQDFAIVRSMVFLGAVLYVMGLLLTDISYTLVDPRVRLQ
ncbi:MAG: ABC transporter permease [Gammaproteobacteria bacterium]|nr:ABC transporter permease [Gammaproteobacteria bacterium]